MNFKHLVFAGILLLAGACTSTQSITNIPDIDPVVLDTSTEVRNLDTLVVTADADEADAEEILELPVYRASADRTADLLHTKLDLRFDWANESVIGSASLVLTPYFYPLDTITLDAKGFDIQLITLGADYEPSYGYDGNTLKIALDKTYRKGQRIKINIDYIAHPSEGENGSAAITSDKGLFFINADGSDPEKPQQIWTQGETEFNSRWFPTIDKPNERSTQEVLLTVDEKYQTLSNGVMQSSESNGDGTRTDYWVMNQPHAPYLFMIAVGEFATVEESWSGKDILYMVEEPYRDDAKEIFAHTVEMLEFFSDFTGINYPWDKYAQIVVRDYVSGAMENTTSVIYGEFVQKHARELIDNDNDYIVAHELFHHWFGDYVTCESWANLVLNEGFANYAEYLWKEFKYGKDRADQHRLTEIQGYLYQASSEIHPLIDFSYEDKEDMFDQHSYNKGGLVLHMLRYLVGDAAFKASLHTFLRANAYQSVEVHDLRLAFEKTTGLDLNWFFDQWYFASGHPALQIDYTYNPSEVVIDVAQIQDVSMMPSIFILPTEVDLHYEDGTRERISIQIDRRNQTFTIPVSKPVSVAVLDPDRVLLAVYIERRSDEEYVHLYSDSAALSVRLDAVEHVGRNNVEGGEDVIVNALSDPFWSVRSAAMEYFEPLTDEDKQVLSTIAKEDPHSVVKVNAINRLSEVAGAEYLDMIASGINHNDAYPVVAASIKALNKIDPEACRDKLGELETESQSDIVAAISSIYAESGDTSYLNYFEQHMTEIEGLPALDFYRQLETLLEETSDGTLVDWMQKCSEVATDDTVSPYTKISAMRTIIVFLRQNRALSDQIQPLVDKVMSTETDDEIKSIYRSFLGM